MILNNAALALIVGGAQAWLLMSKVLCGNLCKCLRSCGPHTVGAHLLFPGHVAAAQRGGFRSIRRLDFNPAAAAIGVFVGDEVAKSVFASVDTVTVSRHWLSPSGFCGPKQGARSTNCNKV